MTRQKRSGFTLMAVVLSMIILTIGVLAMARTEVVLMSGHTQATERTSALAIARAHMEDLRSRDPTSLVAEPAMSVGIDGVPAGSGPYTRSVTVAPVAHNLVDVSVIVTYPHGRAPVTLEALAFTPTT